MPNNKYIINESQLVDIADAIRDKRGEQDTYTVDEMPSKIENIPKPTLCTVTFKNISQSDLGDGAIYDFLDMGNQIFYNPNDNSVLDIYYRPVGTDIPPQGTREVKIFNLNSIESFDSNIPLITLGIYCSSYTSDYSNLFQDLNNISIAVIENEQGSVNVKSSSNGGGFSLAPYTLIPYSTDPTRDSSFTVILDLQK